MIVEVNFNKIPNTIITHPYDMKGKIILFYDHPFTECVTVEFKKDGLIGYIPFQSDAYKKDVILDETLDGIAISSRETLIQEGVLTEKDTLLLLDYMSLNFIWSFSSKKSLCFLGLVPPEKCINRFGFYNGELYRFCDGRDLHNLTFVNNFARFLMKSDRQSDFGLRTYMRLFLEERGRKVPDFDYLSFFEYINPGKNGSSLSKDNLTELLKLFGNLEENEDVLPQEM